MDIFSVKDFSAIDLVSEIGTKLDSDDLYCVKISHILHISPFICCFSFSPMIISVADFTAPIGASVFKFCVYLKVGQVCK